MRSDPSRTAMIRHAFERGVSARLSLLQKAIEQKLVKDDALGDKMGMDALLGNSGEWKFLTDPAKLQAFRDWLTQRIAEGLLYVDPAGDPWMSEWVESAYKKAFARAFTDARAKDMLRKGPAFIEGAKTFFVTEAFSKPESMEKVKLLSMRALESLRGVTSQMASQMTRILADGLAHGKSPREIAREMSKTVTELGKTRALTIARTEIIHAHAEGQLDAFEKLGVEDVGVLAEWSTAGDEKVCPACAENEGTLFTIGEARGMIPLHPNCRCAWIPSNAADDRERLKGNG